MFLVLLNFAEDKSRAPEFLAAHKDWLQRSIEEGSFLLVGGHERGGLILAQGLAPEEIRARLHADPFVRHNVVRPQLIEFDPSLADERLAFLLPGGDRRGPTS